MPSVRVLDANGQMIGVMPTNQALRMAEGQGLDLVEITPNAQPPVCKIMDYGKFRYEESIKAKQQRKAQKTTQVKEIKFHPGTDIGDLKPVGADGEIKEGGVFEEGAKNQIDTFAKKFCLTRKMIINDDLGAFLKVPAAGQRCPRSYPERR